MQHAAEDTQAKIRHYAVGLLAKRDYAVQELQDKLSKKFSQESSALAQDFAKQTVAWLIELGYLNDANYCAMFVRSSIAKGRGRLRIEQELRQKQLSADLIDQALDEAEVDWFQLAYDVLVRKFGLPAQKTRREARQETGQQAEQEAGLEGEPTTEQDMKQKIKQIAKQSTTRPLCPPNYNALSKLNLQFLA